MVLGVQHRFARNRWSMPPPMTFTLDTYLARSTGRNGYESTSEHRVLTRDKWSLIERFFETVVGQSRTIFSAPNATRAWIRSLLPPLETQCATAQH